MNVTKKVWTTLESVCSTGVTNLKIDLKINVNYGLMGTAMLNIPLHMNMIFAR